MKQTTQGEMYQLDEVEISLYTRTINLQKLLNELIKPKPFWKRRSANIKDIVSVLTEKSQVEGELHYRLGTKYPQMKDASRNDIGPWYVFIYPVENNSKNKEK